MSAAQFSKQRKNKRRDYAFRHQFNEKPSIILGCPGASKDASEHPDKLLLLAGLLWHSHCTSP